MTAPAVPLGSILGTLGFRRDNSVPIPNVWVRGRRNGRRFAAHLQGDKLNVCSVSPRRTTETLIGLTSITASELERAVREVIRS